MTTDGGGGILIDPGDPAAKVAGRVSAHALERYAQRYPCPSRSALVRSVLEAMRSSVRGVLSPHLCAGREALHEGQVAEYWIAGPLVLVVVEGRRDKAEFGGRVLATVYQRNQKYLTPEEMAQRLVDRQPDQRIGRPRRLGPGRPPRTRRRRKQP
jgi:hypothetical protein